MRLRTTSARELIAIGAVCLLVIGRLAVRYVTASDTSSTTMTGATPPTAIVAASSPPTMLAVTATPISTEATPIVVIDPSVTLPADTLLQTPADAIARATAGAISYLGAQHPHVARVTLMTLKAALEAAQTDTGRDPALAMQGHDPSEATIPVWRVELDGDRFQVPHCAAALTPTPCGSGLRAILTLRATDGIGISTGIPAPVSN